MVFFKAALQAAQDRHCFLDTRFVHFDFLEAARERVILFEHAAILCVGGRSNTFQIAGCERWFQQVGRVQGAA